MASWFNADALKGLTEQVTERVSSAASSIPMKIEGAGELVQKLTLTSPELRAEHDRIDQEERRKEEVRDMLAGMLPWETRDSERDILVEECREAVLKLSSCEDVFLGPYEMPRLAVKVTEGDDDAEKGEDGDGVEGHILGGGGGGVGGGEGGITGVNTSSVEQQKLPSEESLERLKTLEPLPPLLQDFDLDSHVGLINRLLKEDPKLVEMQAKVSGGGEREVVFWRNYFFNCAWCRYEAGLSIDEWYNPSPIETEDGGPNNPNKGADDREEEIHFESEHEEAAASEEKAFPADPETDADAPFNRSSSERGEETTTTTTTKTSTSPTTSPPATGATPVSAESRSDAASSADFEMVGNNAEDDDDDFAAGDPVDDELDELEAEIARELED